MIMSRKFLDAALNGAAGYAGKAYLFNGTKYVRFNWDTDMRDAGYPLGLDEWELPAPFDKGIDAAVPIQATCSRPLAP